MSSRYSTKVEHLKISSFRISFAALSLAASLPAQVNVLTSNYDLQRTNSTNQETVLNQSNVNTTSFGKIGYFPVDGEIYAQPLYASGIAITGHGTRNVVYVATMHNSVYAIDADQPASTLPLWQVNFGPSIPATILNENDILPEVGILSTPAIDLTRQLIYVVSDTLDGGTPAFRLHALSLANGQEMLNGPVVIAAAVQGNGAGSSGGSLVFDPSIHLQRPGLALANGTLYLAFGSRADLGNWHGWVMSYDASSLHQIAFVCTSPDGYGASIWQSGRAPAIDASGNVYVATGNGSYNGTVNFGESILKFSGTDLTLLDWFTPNVWADWNDNDSDLGSSGTILLPATNQVLTSGKSGDLFVVNTKSMGHLASGNSSTSQDIQANQGGTYDTALWNSPAGAIAYVQELAGSMRAFQVVNGTLNATMQSETVPSTVTIFAGIAVSSNNNASGSALVWQTTADYHASQQPGILHALDASDLSHELWNSDMTPTDALGRFAKFVPPTVANGRVYVPTFSNELAIYGLLSGSPSSVIGPPQITAVTNGVSFLEGAVSPGEFVTVFGANLGPTLEVGLEVGSNGRLTTTLAHTKVYIDGIAAPLLFASANQVGAIVPFGISGSKIPVQVQNGSQYSTSTYVPVAAASPALFSQDGTGGEIGAIINQDGNLNSFSDTAARGSVVMLYATGAGLTNPAGADGQIVSSGPYPTPLLPVQVFIDGQAADVLYAGAAPGMVQGIIQINARVPAGASSGQVDVVLQVGSYSSPNTTTIVVQ